MMKYIKIFINIIFSILFLLINFIYNFFRFYSLFLVRPFLGYFYFLKIQKFKLYLIKNKTIYYLLFQLVVQFIKFIFLFFYSYLIYLSIKNYDYIIIKYLSFYEYYPEGMYPKFYNLILRIYNHEGLLTEYILVYLYIYLFFTLFVVKLILKPLLFSFINFFNIIKGIHLYFTLNKFYFEDYFFIKDTALLKNKFFLNSHIIYNYLYCNFVQKLLVLPFILKCYTNTFQKFSLKILLSNFYQNSASHFETFFWESEAFAYVNNLYKNLLISKIDLVGEGSQQRKFITYYNFYVYFLLNYFFFNMLINNKNNNKCLKEYFKKKKNIMNFYEFLNSKFHLENFLSIYVNSLTFLLLSKVHNFLHFLYYFYMTILVPIILFLLGLGFCSFYNIFTYYDFLETIKNSLFIFEFPLLNKILYTSIFNRYNFWNNVYLFIILHLLISICIRLELFISLCLPFIFFKSLIKYKITKEYFNKYLKKTNGWTFNEFTMFLNNIIFNSKSYFYFDNYNIRLSKKFFIIFYKNKSILKK